MTTLPRQILSKNEALDLIGNGSPLTNTLLDKPVFIDQLSIWKKELVIENCCIENLSAISVKFEKPVRLINSYFKNCSFTFSYFSQGLLIQECTFDNYLDFQSGGHNKPGFPVILQQNMFHDFVNFFDCWYKGDFQLINNQFQKGTNIRNKNLYIRFDVEPVIKDNVGSTDFKGEIPMMTN